MKGDYAVIRFRISTSPRWASLTRAEAEVARYVLKGLSNKQIALRRRTCERTVANQLASLYRKLDVSSRAELANAFVRALSAGTKAG